MRSIQEVFNETIDSGYYNPRDNAMCNSLYTANFFDVITIAECLQNIKAIRLYKQHRVFLAAALRDNHLPSDYVDRLQIYRNWNDRPVLYTTPNCNP